MNQIESDKNAILVRRFFSSFNYSLILSFFYLYLSNNLKYDLVQIGFIFALLISINQMFSIFSGVLGEYLGLEFCMIIGCLLDSFSYLLLGISKNYNNCLIAVIGIAIGGCLFSTNARALLLSFSNENKKISAKLQGNFIILTNIGNLLSPLIGIYIIKYGIFTSSFIFCSIIELILAIYIIVTSKKVINLKKEKRDKLLIFYKLKSVINFKFIKIHISALLPYVLISAFPIVFPIIFSEILNEKNQIPIAFFLNSLLIILFQRWCSERFLYVKNNAYSLLLCFILMLSSILLCFLYNNIAFAYVSLIVFSICEVISITLVTNAIVLLETKDNRSLIFGISKLILSLSSMFSIKKIPTIIEKLKDIHIMNFYYKCFLGLFLFIISILCIQVIKKISNNSLMKKDESIL